MNNSVQSENMHVVLWIESKLFRPSFRRNLRLLLFSKLIQTNEPQTFSASSFSGETFN